ncbi:MAG: hypothetical protein IJ297_06315 [Clostridia bacterium]|nr:hypothetical protein [Clostridia bacterium]
MHNKLENMAKYIPHIGMRKMKSIIAVFIGFCLWQLIRLFVPGLEVHPIYIYIYGILEMRDTPDKTVDFGRLRIKATFIALCVGMPLLLLSIYLKTLTGSDWVCVAIELGVVLIGSLIVLCVAEITGCGTFCGFAAAVLIILVISHGADEPLVYSFLRAVQTIIGVFIAWLVNAKLFPYPKKEK